MTGVFCPAPTAAAYYRPVRRYRQRTLLQRFQPAFQWICLPSRWRKFQVFVMFVIVILSVLIDLQSALLGETIRDCYCQSSTLPVCQNICRPVTLRGFDSDGHKPWRPTWWNLFNDVKWTLLHCTFSVSFSRFHCRSRHGHGLWPPWYRPTLRAPPRRTFHVRPMTWC